MYGKFLLTTDPHDLGREYKEIIRINFNRVKVEKHIMESEFGYNMPAMQIFRQVVKNVRFNG
ncbi:MAG: hypothetical protein ACLU2J_04605 [Clostridia bacterium]